MSARLEQYQCEAIIFIASSYNGPNFVPKIELGQNFSLTSDICQHTKGHVFLPSIALIQSSHIAARIYHQDIREFHA